MVTAVRVTGQDLGQAQRNPHYFGVTSPKSIAIVQSPQGDDSRPPPPQPPHGDAQLCSDLGCASILGTYGVTLWGVIPPTSVPTVGTRKKSYSSRETTLSTPALRGGALSPLGPWAVWGAKHFLLPPQFEPSQLPSAVLPYCSPPPQSLQLRANGVGAYTSPPIPAPILHTPAASYRVVEPCEAGSPPHPILLLLHPPTLAPRPPQVSAHCIPRLGGEGEGHDAGSG